MTPRPSIAALRRPAILASAVALCLGIAACGNKQAHPTTADTEGLYVDAGDISYQVQLSRQLNPFSVEDRGYLAGVATPAPRPDQEWFAVFLWAKNETHSNQTTSSSFDIVDTQGTKYYPVSINSQVNPYAWTARTLKPLGIEPAPDSTASFGPTQGSLLLFKLDTAAYSNRPLTLEIYPPGGAKPSSVSLDL